MQDEVFRQNIEIARGLSPDDESYYARMIRGNTIYHRDWLALNEARHHMRWKWAEFFKDYDLLLCPPAASAAFPHNQVGERWEQTIQVNGHPVPTTDQLFWAGYSGMVYLPSTVAPAGFTPARLPVGVQIIGRPGEDETALAAAAVIEKAFGGCRPAPLPS